jgi:hypothetical protein
MNDMAAAPAAEIRDLNIQLLISAAGGRTPEARSKQGGFQ